MIAFLALLLAIAPLIVLAVRNSDRDILVAIGAGGSGLAFFAAFAAGHRLPSAIVTLRTVIHISRLSVIDRSRWVVR